MAVTFGDDEDTRHLRPWHVTCMTINLVMGSGFLGVPMAFYESGLLLGPMVLGRSTKSEDMIYVLFRQPSEYKSSINMHLYYIEKALLCSALSHFKFCAFINMVFLESKM